MELDLIVVAPDAGALKTVLWMTLNFIIGSLLSTDKICTFAKYEIDKMPKVQSSEGELWGLLSA